MNHHIFQVDLRNATLTGLVCFSHYYKFIILLLIIFFCEGEATSGLMLIGSQPDDTFFVVSCTILWTEIVVEFMFL